LARPRIEVVVFRRGINNYVDEEGVRKVMAAVFRISEEDVEVDIRTRSDHDHIEIRLPSADVPDAEQIRNTIHEGLARGVIVPTPRLDKIVIKDKLLNPVTPTEAPRRTMPSDSVRPTPTF